MGRTWRRNRKGVACPACGEANGWCQQSAEGAIDCMKAQGLPVPGLRLISSKTGKDGAVHSIYVPEGTEIRALDPGVLKKREDEERRYREWAVKNARELWQEVAAAESKDHPIARAYFEGRGISVAKLPRGVLPETVRFFPRTPRDEESTGAEGGGAAKRPKKVRVERPAVVCCGQRYQRDAVDRAKWIVRTRCVQRIFLADGCSAEKAVKLPGEMSKMALGSTGGDEHGGAAAVRLSAPDPRGELVLCEGIETGMALLAALGREDGTWPEVWACISAGGIVGCRLPESRVARACGGEAESSGITRVVIAGDLDRVAKMSGQRPGTAAANIAANGLRAAWSGLRVDVVLPDARCAPKLVDADGEIIGEAAGADSVKSVDWLDVLRVHGAEAVRGAMGAATAPVDDGEFNEDKLVGERRMDRAKKLLSRLCPASDRRAGECWPLRRYGGQWWVWVKPERGVPRWKMVPQELMEARATDELDQLWVSQRGKVKPLAPSPREVTAALTAAMNFVAVSSDTMPCWLPASFDERSEPLERRLLDFGDSNVEGPAPSESVVAFSNGLLDVDAWVDGRIVLHPPTPRWFSRSCCPFDLPVEKLREAELEGEVDRMVLEACPTWLAFLHQASGQDEQWQDSLRRYFGYCLTSDISLEKILWLQGEPGTGKGTICTALEQVVGQENYASTSLEAITGRFDLAAFVGRSVIAIPELRVGPMTNLATGLDRLNSISGGDPQTSEDKFARKDVNCRITAKFIITPNEEPKMTDPANAILRRLLVLPMGDPPDKPDPQLKRKIRDEAQGIMLWALYGLRDLRMAVREGRAPFEQPSAGQVIKDEIARAASPVRAFVDDCCTLTAEGQETTEDLFAAWNEWRKVHGHNEMSLQTFGRHLRVGGRGVKRANAGSGAARYKVYRGIRLNAHRVDHIPFD